MSTKHTPGPWEPVCKGKTAPWGVKPTACNRPEFVAGVFGMTGIEQEASARLIAAAPELLEALQDAVSWLGSGSDDDAIKAKELSAAIAKATGKEDA